jgi:hypothetical protein
MKQRHTPFVALLALAILSFALIPRDAGAATAGDITVNLYRVGPVPYGTVSVALRDSQLGHTLRIRRGDFEIGRTSAAVGAPALTIGEATLRPGDFVEIYRPALRAGAPTVAPVNTYTIPSVSLDHSNGVATGTTGDAAHASLRVEKPCGSGSDRFNLQLAQGEFTKQVKVAAGSRMMLSAFNDAGDVTVIDAITEGETPCITAVATQSPDLVPFTLHASEPYVVHLSGLSPLVADDFRLVWRRGNRLIDTLAAADTTGAIFSSVPPRPDDRFEIYRPQTSARPAFVKTVPDVQGTFDRDARSVTVKGPGASQISAVLRDKTGYDDEWVRSVGPVRAGRSSFDFSKPAPPARPVPATPGQVADVDWLNPAGTLDYYFAARPGDLVRPAVSLLSSKKIRLASPKHPLVIRMRASEPVTGTIRLSSSGRLVAVAEVRQKKGTTRAIASLTGAGRKTVRKLTGSGRRRKSIGATLVLRVKDSAGNATTASRSVRLVAR